MNISECQLIRIIRPTAVPRPLQTKFPTTPMEGLSVFGAMQMAQWRNATPNPTPTPNHCAICIAPNTDSPMEALTKHSVSLRLLFQTSVRENVCNISKKRKKSCFLDFPKKRKKNLTT